VRLRLQKDYARFERSGVCPARARDVKRLIGAPVTKLLV